MKQVIALFPGQGSQSVGMAKPLVDNFPWTRALFEEASDATKENLLKLCLDGPADKLQLTQFQQPTILTTSFAWFSVLQKSLDFAPAFGAGHSLGEYSACLASRALTLTEAAALVKTRGELMQKAVPQGQGKMAAVVGLSDEDVEKLCKLSSNGDQSLVVPANFNSQNQVVIAGHATAVDRAMKMAEGPELKARMVVPLNVSAPFHSPLMKSIKEEFQLHLKAIAWKEEKFPVVANLDAQIHKPRNQVALLTEQVDHPVLWTACMKTLVDQKPEFMIEMGPGKVLTGLMKRISKDVKVFSLESIDDFKGLETFWRKV